MDSMNMLHLILYTTLFEYYDFRHTTFFGVGLLFFTCVKEKSQMCPSRRTKNVNKVECAKFTVFIKQKAKSPQMTYYFQQDSESEDFLHLKMISYSKM